MDFTKGLNKFFDIVTASKTEQNFYMNVYRYFDYIFTHPELEQLYEQAGKNYRKKHGAIWAEYDLTGNRTLHVQYRLSLFFLKSKELATSSIPT